MTRVLVIIVTYNAERWLKACLSSIPAESDSISGLVIDNGSTDKTVEIIRHDYPHIEIIENKKNLGFGAANNIGLRKALKENYDFVYLLNQDAWIEPSDILKLVQLSEQNPEFGIISPLQLYKDKEGIDRNFLNSLPNKLKEDFLLRENNLDIYQSYKTVMAAHWLLPINTVKLVGGFSPAFYHYGEDNNYCDRVRFFGKKVGVVPSVYSIHDRKNRQSDTSKKLYLLCQKWKFLFSDPAISNRTGRNLVYASILSSLQEYKYKLIPIIMRLIKDYKILVKYKKESLCQGAFL